MRGPHFFVDPADVDGDRVRLHGEDARHLAVVLRARPGQPVSVADGTGRLFQAVVHLVEPEQVVLGLDEALVVPAPAPRLTVVHGLPKGRKLDEVVQRLSELGVDRLVPVTTARSEVRLGGDRAARAVIRWRAVAHAAAKQSRRARVMQVAEIGEWDGAFRGAVAGAVLWEEGTQPLRKVLNCDAGELVLGIGPEGGLTSAEVAASGLPAGSLGPTVLRTETAALVAASVVLTLAGRLG